MSIKNALQKRLINVLVKNLFNTITKDDILEFQGKDTGGNPIVFYKGKRLEAEKTMALKESARILKESQLWKCLESEIKYVSNLRMFEKGQNTDDILAGKMALYVLEVINNKLNELTNSW